MRAHCWKKYHDRNGRCIAILFNSISVGGWFDCPQNFGWAQMSWTVPPGTKPTWIVRQSCFPVLAQVRIQARYVFAPKWIPPRINQKRPDVHKIVLSIKLRSPPRKVCQFWGFYTDFYSFSSFWAQKFGGGGVNQILRTRILWTPRLFWIKQKCGKHKFLKVLSCVHASANTGPAYIR